MASTTVHGSWTPSKDEPPCNPREAWPSMRAAELSLRERLTPPVLGSSRCRTYWLDRPRQDDAQFYGSKQESGIFLYKDADTDKPFAILEFGPRGGIRRTPTEQ